MPGPWDGVLPSAGPPIGLRRILGKSTPRFGVVAYGRNPAGPQRRVARGRAAARLDHRRPHAKRAFAAAREAEKRAQTSV
ncbi:MAG: hypothetical protein JO318_22040 [Chloroflexi bacterium]|nr:hypothetical protein [Chloroflexota bacterium]